MRTLNVPQGARDYAINRLRIALTTSPDRRDPELLLDQLLSDLGVYIEDLGTGPTGDTYR